MDQSHLNNSGRGPPKDELCEIISKLDQGFRRSCQLSQLLTATTTDGQRTTEEDRSHYVTGELKMFLLQTVWTQMEPSDLGPHCLSVCLNQSLM